MLMQFGRLATTTLRTRGGRLVNYVLNIDFGVLIMRETAQVYHSCRATTCQALLLLGHREFGIGLDIEVIRMNCVLRVIT